MLSEKKILNETKNHNPTPLQVKWPVPNDKQVQELKNINFLSILSDGSTDVSVPEQEIVYIR